MSMKRKRLLVILLIPSLLVISLGTLYLVLPRTGYCFDSAFDGQGERLYVTAGYKGLHVFEVSQQGALTHLTTYFDSGYYRYIEVVGDNAYIANNERGLEILDIREDVPKPLWAQSGSKGYGIHIEKDKAYLASNELGLQIFDVANPQAPVLLGQLTTNGRYWDVWVRGKYAFVADCDRGLVVVDVSAPSRPREIATLSWGDDPMAEVIDGVGTRVYIAAGVNGLIGIDVSDPSEPALTFQYDPGLDSWGEGVFVQGDILYLSMIDSSREENGLHIFDLRDPASPQLLSKRAVSDHIEDLTIAGTRLAVANTLSGVALFELRTPSDPVLIDSFPSRFWRFFTQYFR